MKIERLIAGLATAAFLALGGWTLTSMSSAQARIAVVESRAGQVDKHLDRLEGKVDEILDRLPPAPRWHSGRER